MTDDGIMQSLLEWVEKNPYPSTHSMYRHMGIFKRLATYDDMRPAWRELTKRGARYQDVIHFITSSFEDAESECNRLTTTEENERIAAVMQAVDNLRVAIARAPFLDRTFSVEIDEAWWETENDKWWEKPPETVRPPSYVHFLFRESDHNKAQRELIRNSHTMPTLCLDELLDLAQRVVPDIAARQPGRKVARQREKPETAAFVRHLSARFRECYGDTMKGTIARIATATYDLHEAVSKEHVERILRR